MGAAYSNLNNDDTVEVIPLARNDLEQGASGASVSTVVDVSDRQAGHGLDGNRYTNSATEEGKLVIIQKNVFIEGMDILSRYRHQKSSDSTLQQHDPYPGLDPDDIWDNRDSVGPESTLTWYETRSSDSKTPSQYNEHCGSSFRMNGATPDMLQLENAAREMKGPGGLLRALVEVKRSLDSDGRDVTEFRLLHSPRMASGDPACNEVIVVETHHRGGSEVGQRRFTKVAPSPQAFWELVMALKSDHCETSTRKDVPQDMKWGRAPYKYAFNMKWVDIRWFTGSYDSLEHQAMVRRRKRSWEKMKRERGAARNDDTVGSQRCTDPPPKRLRFLKFLPVRAINTKVKR